MRRRVLVLTSLVVLLVFPAVVFAQETTIVKGRGEVPVMSDPVFANNTVNAEVALKYMNGYVVQPGEIFSFNKAVGPRTLERGFVWGVSVSGGKYVKDVGGGVCMASTALHRAVANAGLQIVEWHRHTGPDFPPNSDDAAVWWGVLDYKFKNTLPYPIRIQTGSNGQSLFVELVGVISQNNNNAVQPASGTVEVAGSVVNLRSGPGTNYAVIGQVKRGSRLTVIGKAQDWYKVVLPDARQAFIAGWLVRPVASGSVLPEKVRVTGSVVNLRSGPGTDYAVVGRVRQGTLLKVVKKVGDWYNVISPNGRSVFIAGWLVRPA